VSERRSTSTATNVRYNLGMAEPEATGGREGANRLFVDLTADVAFGPPARDVDPLLRELASVALDAARAAATILVAAASGPVGGVATKTSDTDLVSDADRASEAAVSRIVRTMRPDDALVAEEGTSLGGGSGVRWLVDPLDGTTNFLFGVPQFCVSIAAEIEGEEVVGVVIDPLRDETWAAVKGGGSRCNGSPCAGAPGRSSLSTALIATGFGYRPDRRRRQALVAASVIPAVRDIRRLGSAALDLCWTAAGRYDAYYEWDLERWDLAAGRLIAAESGLRAEILPGGLIVAASAELFDRLVELIAAAGGFSD
jgi:myo-inositol-1(or 4)-monophosphatase